MVVNITVFLLLLQLIVTGFVTVVMAAAFTIVVAVVITVIELLLP